MSSWSSPYRVLHRVRCPLGLIHKQLSLNYYDRIFCSCPDTAVTPMMISTEICFHRLLASSNPMGAELLFESQLNKWPVQ